MKENLYLFLTSLAFLAVMVFLVCVGAKRQMVVDCMKYQEYEQKYPAFELATSTQALCEEVGISIL